MSDNEPWLLHGHAERLTVSAQVRIRLSGECPHSPPELDGAPGYIFHILEPGERAQYSGGWSLDVGGHRYAVVPELPLNTAGSFCWLAAAELEPLEEDDPDRRAVPYEWTFDGHVARGRSFRNDSIVMTDASARRG